MRCRLLAVDIDGTLLDPTGTLRPIVADAVARARASGVEVLLATGRRFRTARAIGEALALGGPMVVFNGGVVRDVDGVRTHVRHGLDADLRGEALALLREVGPPILWTDDAPEPLDIVTERIEDASLEQSVYLHANHAHTFVVPDLDAVSAGGTVMAGAIGPLEPLREAATRLRSALGERARVRLLDNVHYDGWLLEVLPAGTSKWTGIAHVADALGIDAGAVVAIGDDTNDLEMIRAAGVGIAMGNAEPSVREAADVVVASNRDDGAAHAIERYVLRDGR